MENHLALCIKSEDMHIHDLTILLRGKYSREIHTHVHQNKCQEYSGILVLAQISKQSKCPSVVEWTNCLVAIQQISKHTTIKFTEPQSHVINMYIMKNSID